jgi:hypothetical protein
VARAKKTHRADARRRYRAEHQLVDEPVEGDEDEALDAPAGATATRATARPATSAPPTRPSIGAAFRNAFRPLDIRGDLMALPTIAIRSKALWVPLLLVVASTVAFAITQGADLVTQFMFAYFVQTPAIGGVFLAGFLAPRASWLLGLIVGLASAVCYSALILTVFGAVVDASQVQGLAQDAIISAFVLSPVMGAFFAAAAAWYRRFLNLTNPNRSRQAGAKGQRPDGKTRSSGAQKAGARR